MALLTSQWNRPLLNTLAPECASRWRGTTNFYPTGRWRTRCCTLCTSGGLGRTRRRSGACSPQASLMLFNVVPHGVKAADACERARHEAEQGMLTIGLAAKHSRVQRHGMACRARPLLSCVEACAASTCWCAGNIAERTHELQLSSSADQLVRPATNAYGLPFPRTSLPDDITEVAEQMKHARERHHHHTERRCP